MKRRPEIRRSTSRAGDGWKTDRSIASVEGHRFGDPCTAGQGTIRGTVLRVDRNHRAKTA